MKISQAIEKYERENKTVLPEKYIQALVECDDQPQRICRNFGDISLFSLNEFIEAQAYLQMGKRCPDYVAIGDGGGGEILIMAQSRDANRLIVTDAGSRVPLFFTAEFCTIIEDFGDWVAHGCSAAEINSIYYE